MLSLVSTHNPILAPCCRRYRGVILVASVPILLVVAIVLLMPRANSVADQAHTLTQLRHNAPIVSGPVRYAVVMDAGSTGSRVHVFKFAAPNGGDLVLISDQFQQLQPGLSAYAEQPQKAAESLQPLIDLALSTVPKVCIALLGSGAQGAKPPCFFPGHCFCATKHGMAGRRSTPC